MVEDELNDLLRDIAEAKNPLDEPSRPMHYNRDGTPITGETRTDAMLKWAEMFEHSDRRVAQTITLYGERLSTVFLGMDHSFMAIGPPIIFETMLFAPMSSGLREAIRDKLRHFATTREIGDLADLPEQRYIKKHFPHDNLQERYATEAQAKAGHRKLKLQCLIPPRWREFLLYTIGRDETWRLSWQ